METIPENRSKSYENDQRKHKIVKELSDKGRYIGLRTVREFSVRIFVKSFSNRPVQKIIDGGRSQKRNGATKQNEPRTSENAVKRTVIVRIGRNNACHEENQTSQ